jgi:hypothetical protein
MFQASGKNISSDSQTLKKVLKPARAMKQLAQHEKGPAVANDLECSGD